MCIRDRGSLQIQDAKSRQKIAIWAPSYNFVGYIFATKAHNDNWKNVLSSNISSTRPHNMANFGPLVAEIVSLVWGTPGNFNGFHILDALLHGTLVVGVSQTLRRWTEGTTYIRQGGHHVGHWLTFLVISILLVAGATFSQTSVRNRNNFTVLLIINYYTSGYSAMMWLITATFGGKICNVDCNLVLCVWNT